MLRRHGEQRGIEHKTPLEMWNKVIAVNLTGPWLGCQESVKQLVSQGGPGRIINISSVHEDLPMPTNSPYCAAKGLCMLMRTRALELVPYGIIVNHLAPEVTETLRNALFKEHSTR